MIFEFTEDDIPSPEKRAELQDKINSLREYAGGSMKARERVFLDSLEQFLHANGFLTAGRRERLDDLHKKHLG